MPRFRPYQAAAFPIQVSGGGPSPADPALVDWWCLEARPSRSRPKVPLGARAATASGSLVVFAPSGPVLSGTPNRAGPFINRVPFVSERERRFFDLLSGWFNSFVRKGYIVQGRKPDDWSPVVGGFQAERPPTAADDTATVGAHPGAVWVNTLTQDVWVMTSGAAGAAVWKQITTS